MEYRTIAFRPAQEKDGKIISHLRQQIWRTTYRGIYPDGLIDEFDYAWHIDKDIKRIKNDNYLVFVIVVDGLSVGYLILRKGNPLLLQSLYVLPQYQRKGIGKQAFSFVQNHCRKNGICSFICHCHPDNSTAIAFYLAMGGQIIGHDEENEERWQDSIILTFTV